MISDNSGSTIDFTLTAGNVATYLASQGQYSATSVAGEADVPEPGGGLGVAMLGVIGAAVGAKRFGNRTAKAT